MKRKKINRKPVRYLRRIKPGYIREEVNLSSEVKTGTILEFTYGRKQKPGQVGGWKNDPKPKLLVFYDDRLKYIEGVNTNYLSDWYLSRLNKILLKFPGINGEELYNIVKTSAKGVVEKGYRKYIRPSLKRPMKHIYKVEEE